jgi:diguanylate cyclase (GGDEF)-like protein/PAS domain S-box-containing protein
VNVGWANDNIGSGSLDSAVDQAADGIMITDTNGTILFVNPAFTKMTGYSSTEAVGQSTQVLKSGRQPLGFYEELWSAVQSGKVWQGELINRRKDGTFYNEEMRIAPVRDAHGKTTGYIAIKRDVTERIQNMQALAVLNAKAAEQEINRLAFYDPLTGLPNRRLLLDRLEKSTAFSIRKGRKRALLVIDLDDFMMLNDTLGYETGDLMLQEIALRLTACLREGDTVARQDGDEFIVLLEDLSETLEDAAAQAKGVAEKLLTRVNQPYRLSAQECRITCCIGLTVFGNDQESAKGALQQADIAMYRAKETGRNSLHLFVPALQAAVNTRASMENDIRQAISGNQFTLYYQAQMDLGHLVGAEALLRWKHPTRGLVLPDEFISIAEESGLIVPLGNWVLETACRQIAAWANHKESASISVAVNISAYQFRQRNFVDQVLEALNISGANPRNLKLELTESVLLHNVEDVIAKMTDLKSYGVSFSVDDFGTGYSSLTYLKRLPLDQLKIDRSFIRDILIDVSSGAIAQSIISMSGAMGLSVIAEGVETEKQRQSLDSMGCHSFQGYLFSRPVPLEDFQLLLRSLASIPGPMPKSV